MPIPTTFADLSTTIASNSPAGSDNVFPDLDNYLRALSGMLASVYANSGNGWTSPYLPAANPSYTGTLTGGTGVVNLGSGQFYKDASGNVGIGTSTPGVKLEVNGGAIKTTSWAEITPTTATNNALFRSTNTGGTLYSGLDNSAGGVTGAAYAGMLWHTGAYPLAFATSNTERMRIDASGNVGIGAAPAGARRLEVYSGNGQTDILVGSTSAGNVGVVMRWDNAGANGYVYTTGSAPLLLGTNSAERMRIDASGNVGIGTSAPGYPLHVYGTSPDMVSGNSGANGTRAGITARNDAVYLCSTYTTSNVPMVFLYGSIGPGGTEMARFDTAGNLIPTLQTSAPTLTTNSQMVFTLTSNTNLRISVRGSDGTTRTTNLTLA